MRLEPQPEVPGTLTAEVGGLAVAVDMDEPLASVTLAGEIAALSAAQCGAAAQLLLHAQALLTQWAPADPPAPAAGPGPTGAADD